jgi:hypothetical protein
MKFGEQIKQILTEHTIDVGSDGRKIIPDYELDDIIAEVLEILKSKGQHYPESQALGGAGRFLYLKVN